jgi:hypothetical protein
MKKTTPHNYTQIKRVFEAANKGFYDSLEGYGDTDGSISFSLDESMMVWVKGKEIWIRFIPRKPNEYGVLIYMVIILFFSSLP